ncbi:hypothetical protein [Marinomonas ostreistagni]|uniref:Uncharacterized protein n=1 Tax=Marinomonas ostreistagni TaxID=359209 RepID=A0ABS0ZAF3_9GAMM|nr:hypothetical protein [Marinomonas ostreistagni]MBJ7550637.1 hypothetical protein [Marinomonas ostreistagni]
MMVKHFQGWLIIEAMFAVAGVAFILSVAQSNQSELDQGLLQLKESVLTSKRQSFQNSVTRVFDLEVPISTSLVEKPSCQSYKGAAIQHVLKYELNQW